MKEIFDEFNQAVLTMNAVCHQVRKCALCIVNHGSWLTNDATRWISEDWTSIGETLICVSSPLCLAILRLCPTSHGEEGEPECRWSPDKPIY